MALTNLQDYGGDIAIRGDTLSVDLWYPRVEDQPNKVSFIEIELMDTRAADNLRVSYDYDRDGWKIEQAQVFEWDANDTICDPQWKEVAFVQAWGSRIK